MSKVKTDNYIHIQGWMVSELKLRGNELLIYAIIHGFSQDSACKYEGSLSYLAEWTNSTRQGVIKSLKRLLEKGLIQKEEVFKKGLKFVNYWSTKFNGMVNKVDHSGQQSLMHNIEDNIEDNIFSPQPTSQTHVDVEILEFLNKCSGYKYKAVETNLRLIRQRLKDYSKEELMSMIEYKCNEWGSDKNMSKYLRPATLFRPLNCESYVALAMQQSNQQRMMSDHINTIKQYEAQDEH